VNDISPSCKKVLRLEVVVAVDFAFAVAFLVVIPSAASEPAVSRFSFMSPKKDRRGIVLARKTCGGASKEREEAGSLAALGMTTRKAKAQAMATSIA
jgi:hypothetical protein